MYAQLRIQRKDHASQARRRPQSVAHDSALTNSTPWPHFLSEGLDCLNVLKISIEERVSRTRCTLTGASA